jgi:hypothetical protein
MSTALTLVSETLPAALGPDLTAAIDLAKAEKAVSTRKAYGTDFRLFRQWCEARGVSALPAAPQSVAAYLAAHAASSKASTLGRRVAAIRYAHKLAGLALPTDAEGVKATMRGIRRTYGSARIRKAPAVAGKMLGMVATAPEKLAGLRDRALLLVGSVAHCVVRSSLPLMSLTLKRPRPGYWCRSGPARPTRSGRGPLSRLLEVTLPALPRRCGNGWRRLLSKQVRSSARSTREAR